MGDIESLFNIDWKAFIIAVFVILFGFQAAVQLFQWFLFDFLGIETKAMRQRKE